jgi:hypothetical protein
VRGTRRDERTAVRPGRPQAELAALREWASGEEQRRLAEAAVALAAQRERLSSVAGPAAASSPAMLRLLSTCDQAAADLEALAAGVAEAQAEAAARLEERGRRRAALKLIEVGGGGWEAVAVWLLGGKGCLRRRQGGSVWLLGGWG